MEILAILESFWPNCPSVSAVLFRECYCHLTRWSVLCFALRPPQGIYEKCFESQPAKKGLFLAFILHSQYLILTLYKRYILWKTVMYNLYQRVKIHDYCQKASFKIKLSFLKDFWFSMNVWLGIIWSFTKLNVLMFLKTK